jgi:hypothetical protein
MVRHQLFYERPDISVDDGNISARFSREFAHNIVHKIATLEAIPNIATRGIESHNRIVFDIKNYCSVPIDDRTKMCGGTSHRCTSGNPEDILVSNVGERKAGGMVRNNKMKKRPELLSPDCNSRTCKKSLHHRMCKAKE